MTDALRDDIARYVPPLGTDVLRFHVLLSSATDIPQLRDQVELALSQLSSRYPYADAVHLPISKWENYAVGSGDAAQPEIKAQLPVPIAEHQVVIAFADQRLGPKTREEVLEALEAAGPRRPYLLFFIARKSTAKFNETQKRRQRDELETFAASLEADRGGVVHTFDDAADLRRGVAEELGKYLARHLAGRARPQPAARAAEPLPPEHESPYPGPTSMGFADAHRFYGREDKVDEYARLLAQGRRALFVRGPSGIGKSSLLMAGLMPRLAKERPAHTALLIADLGQGAGTDGSVDPFLAFARAKLVSGTEPARPLSPQRDHDGLLARHLAAAPLGLAEALIEQKLLDPGHTQLVVCLDQAEYLLSRCTPAAVAAFSRVLKRSVDAGRLELVCTWRDDEDKRLFLDAPYAELRELIDGNLHNLGPLSLAGMRSAIEKPARRAGYDIEALVDVLLDDAAAEPNPLPLLAAALNDVHRRWHDRWKAAPADARPPRVYTRDLYDDLKGVIDRAAAQALALLSPEEEEALQSLFWRMVHFDVGRGTEEPRLLEREVLQADAPLASVAARLDAARLLVSSGAGVEFAHSRVLNLWEHLAVWIRERRVDLEQRSYLTLRYNRWEASRRDPGNLLSWESAVAARALLSRLEPHLREDKGVQQVRRLVDESHRIRGLLEGIKMVDFDLIGGGLRAGAQLTEDDCRPSRTYAFYKALTGDDDTTFGDDEWSLVANRGYRLAHFAAFTNNVATLRAMQGRMELLASRTASGKTPLHMAASVAAVQAADLLIRAGCDIDALDEGGRTPLSAACYRGLGPMMDFLLYCGASPHGVRGERNVPPVCDVIDSRDPSMLQRLLDHGADPDGCRPDGRAALHLAVLAGDSALVDVLVARGAALDAPDQKGWMPLHIAAYVGSADLLGRLLRSGADPALRLGPEAGGGTALHVAAGQGHVDACRLLLAHAPAAGPALVDAAALDASTALHLAARYDRAEVVALLLDAGARVDARDAYGETPLGDAARAGSVAAMDVIARHLQADLLGPAARTALPQDGKGGVAERTALHIAAAARQATACARLLEIDPRQRDALDADGYTPVHSAAHGAQDDQLDVLELLRLHGADLQAPARDGWLPMHVAAASGHLRAFAWFVEHDPEERAFDRPGPAGGTALHIAVAQLKDAPQIRFVEALLQNGADPNAVDAQRRTALHFAAIRGSLGCIGLLLAHDADVAALDADGKTALDWALEAGQDVAGARLRWASAPGASSRPIVPWLAADAASNDAARAAVADLHAAARAPRWHHLPVLGPPWEPMADNEAIDLLAALDAYQRGDGQECTLAQHTLTGVRAMALPFYPGFRLVELALTVAAPDGGDRVLACLWGPRAEYAIPADPPRQLLVLDGTSTPLNRLSCRLPVHFEDEASAAMFLRLFCGYLADERNSFVTVDSFDALQLPDEPAREAWRSLEPALVPVRCKGSTPDSFLFDAAVLFRDRLYETVVRVDRCGVVQMEGDRVLTPQPLPVRPNRWLKDGYRVV